MPRYSKYDVVLVRYPFSDFSNSKVRPAVIVSAPHASQDLFIVPLTSRTSSLFAGEFRLRGWVASGLNVPTAVKRGIYTIHGNLVVKLLGRLTDRDVTRLKSSLTAWLGLPD